MSERTEAYNRYVKLFNEQHIPLVTKINGAISNGEPVSEEDERASNSVTDELDLLFRQMPEDEKKMTSWWGIRANAKDFVSFYDHSVETLMTSEYTEEAVRDMYQKFLEQTGWLIAVIKNDYINKTAPPDGWRYETEPCECNKSETKSE